MTAPAPARLSPGDTIGIVGGGQLGRMLALAAARLGLRCHVYTDEEASPASAVVARTTVAPYDDGEALRVFAEAVAVVTYEFENVPSEPLAQLGARVRPSVEALRCAQDRLTEKAFFARCGLPVARHAAVASPAEIAEAMAALGGPVILKTRRMGYDGKGQVSLAPGDDTAGAFVAIGEAPAIVEARVPFLAEASTVLVRGVDGLTSAYETPRNVHEGGILRRSELPGPLTAEAQASAFGHARRLAEALDYVGVLAVEWFVTGDAATPLIANEMAPRVHNSGHWTMDAAATSQFENHIRAIAGWPLGDTARTADVAMHNLIGEDVHGWADHAGDPRARLHLYGKSAVRPGRKMGHVNFIGRNLDTGADGC